ncbi:prepilin-type N-terminal cleavage/methylation domain-containing protein [Blautia faecis]|uniref:type II secretion system protein n=1 Tax=Blautia faecis TaxID=871665 RepID=UPI00157117A1|nr:type II secretion system protein [Blautia faecis]NSG89466.1 prepilin-type N-terminal cleavage/methylation domain-containing protein [Blautia faecis]
MNPFYNKKKKGYTLAEVLATVAILLILMAIAVPAIFSIRKNLRQKALDNKAELIYTAVQNNLVKLQSNGNSSLYDGEKTAKAMGRTPSDATKEQKLYYALSTEKADTTRAASVLVTTDTVDGELYNNYWVVEYNPESASVYAVFYSESDSIKPYDPNVYDSFRYKDNRLSDGARIGYYGGDALDGSNTAVLAPKITVTNEEKLVATITCMRPGQDDKKLGFDVVLSDDQGNKLNLSYKAVGDKLVHTADDLYLADQSPADQEKADSNEESSIVGRSYTLKITLDDLKNEASRFVSIYGEKNQQLANRKITPLNAGTNLHIKITVRSDNYKIDGLATECTTNSLFADQSTSNQAVVYYGRHLQNLDLASGVTEGITEAVVKNPVHFEKQEDKEEGDTSSWYSCYGDKAFTPITNTYLKKFSGERTAIIYHLTVKEGVKIAGTERKGAGMFAVLKDSMTVENLRLAGTTIAITGEGKEKVSVGAIAGETTGSAKITNCEVYLDTEDIEGKNENDVWISGAGIQGGLIGHTNSVAESGSSVTIVNSFAATVMDGRENGTTGDLIGTVGGLIGQADCAVNIKNCYADSYLTGDVTGGLIGSVNSGSVNVEYCYTAGYQNPANHGGGLVASSVDSNALKIKNSYTVATYLENSESNNNPVIYAVSPGTLKNVYYLNKGKNVENDNGKAVDYLTFSNKAKMAEKLNNNGSNSFTTSTTTYAYNLRNQGLTSYSYPSLKDISHYGDWQASYEAGSLVYYEKYAINESNSREYGFFGGNVQSSLSDSLTVVGDGYGIVYAKSALETLSGFIVSYQNSEDADKLKEWKVDCNSTETEKFEVSVNDGDTAQSEETYVIFPLPKEIMNAQAIKGVYYQKLTVKGASDAELNDEGTAAQADGDETTEVMTGKTFYFNPHFAKSVEAADQAPNNILAIYLRTPRQLYHMSLYYQDYASLLKGISFIQERDIDYAPYDWKNYEGVQEAVTVQSPVGVAEDGTITPFTSTYKGGGYEIRGISFATKGTAVGFTGENQGSIQNVFLVSDWENNDFTGTTEVSNPYLSYTGTIGSNRNVYMGALAGINKGTIQNCAVCGYSMGRDGIVYVQRNGTLYIGGLTGSNQGNIYNSEVDAPAVNASVLYGNAYLGGFAGENIGSGLIRNSYAVGNVSIEYSKGANCTIGGFTAKNTGVLRGDYCAVALGAAGTSKTYGFSPKGGGVVSSDCYYLSGGTFRYLNNMLPFSNDQGAGIHVTYQEMVEKAMKGTMADESRCNGATDEENYPFNAVVTQEGKKVHYGNWQIPVNLGSIGVIYWEHEEGGANDGYHFSYIGYKASSQDPTSVLDKVGDSTLCTRHDDGGRITEYGYGYYYATGSAEPDPTMYCFQAGDSENAQASENLTNQLDGVTVVAYTTAPAIGISRSSDTSCYMKMTANDRTANGIWQFSYNSQLYTFTINPFFANAMQYGSNSPDYDGIQSATVTVLEDGFEVQVNAKEAMPGENGKEYEIRSAEQLQYLNWNYKTGTATKILDTTDDVELVDKYSYLGYMTGNDAPVSADYNWIQSHDVDANMTSAPDGGNVFFTQIGSMYDSKSSANVVDADASISYFNGVYNGNTYSIKNIEINSKNTVTGLFGSIIGAKVSNVILYSEKGNYIQRYSGKERGWHVLGGLCGLAAVGKGNSAENVKISNCTVSGYTIQDNSDKGAYGDSSIGGMFGMSTMDLRECTAVNTIIINMTENNRTESVRVGGLVGSMRGVISNCYTGGEITCTDTCLQKRGTRLMLAGISGGIYIKNKGNLLELLGNSILGIEGASDDTRGNAEQCKTATTIIQNCYTYIKMPIDKAKRITSIEPIGSNGETHDEKYKDWGESNYHVRIQITNCYYYEDNIPVIRHEYMAGKNWNNIDDTAIPLSWAEMSGEKDVDSTIGGKTGENAIRVTGSFVELLNQSVDSEDKYAIRGTFAKVTTEENDQDVDGKYSFPGNRTDLEGENYPFPTILTQKTKRGTSVNVHYGAWPLEGIFWRESRATMDIFEDMDLEQTDDSNPPRALKTFYLDSNLVGDDSLGKGLTLNNGFTVEYSNGDDKDDTAIAAVSQQSDWSDGFSEGVEISDGTETFVSASEAGDNVQTETQTSDQKDYIAQIVKLEYSETEKCYVATVEALKTGTTVITVRATVRKTVDNQEIELEYQASFTLTVTADLTVYSDSAEIKGELHQTSDKITLYAVPTSQALSVKEAGSSGSTAEVGADGFSSDGSGVAIEEDAAQSEESGISMESLEADVDTENLDDVGGFESDPQTASGFEVEISEGQNVQTSGDQKIAVYADTAPSKNFASMMTWTITEDPVGAVTVSEISDNQFTVTIESLVPATLTVKGTYTYKGVEYTSYTWINVIGLESGQTVSTDPSDSETGADWAGSSADSANYSSDAASGWEDQNNDTIDIIPNESPDDFSEDDGSWESGDSGF